MQDGSSEPQTVFPDPGSGEIQNFDANFKYVDLAQALRAIGVDPTPLTRGPRDLDKIGGDGDDVMRGGSGDDRLSGQGGDDRIEGKGGDDHLLGDDGDDDLHGAGGDDHLFGGDGDDDLHGAGGGDHLVGGDDDDRLDGGRGHDVLVGGEGDDTLRGGDGIDWFVFASAGDGDDRIRDFHTRGGERDHIVFAATLFTNFTGDDGADLAAGGFLRARSVHGQTEIQIDADGGGNAWTTIAELSGRVATDTLAQQVIIQHDPLV